MRDTLGVPTQIIHKEGSTWLQLEYRDSRPIHQQVRDGLRRLMVTGVLSAGDRLPSVRKLATELAINPNTIQRAYAQLEAEGYVYSVAGRGTFVAEQADQNQRRIQELRENLAPMVEELKNLGMTEQQWLALWKGGESDA